MTDARNIPTPASSDLTTFRILLDGKEMNSEYHVMFISVFKGVNRIPTAEIILLDGDAAKEDFKNSNSKDFIPGTQIEILAGYHSNESTLFKGVVIKHSIRTRDKKPSQLYIECRDLAVKMTIGRKSAYFRDMKDNEIVEQIIKKHSLSADIESTKVKNKKMVQYDATDWDFVVMRAEANGKLVIADDGKISIKAPDTSQTPALSLMYGSTIQSFEAEMDACTQFSAVQTHGWDPAGQKVLQEDNESVSFKEPGNLKSSDMTQVIGLKSYCQKQTGLAVDEELRSWSNAGMLRSRMAKILGRVKFQGYGKIKPGQLLELKGVGDRFNGDVFIAGVHHNITTENWETEIQFGLSAQWFSNHSDINNLPAAGVVPGVHGCQIGIVTKLENDPDGEDRVQVRMPMIDDQDDGIWARIASLDAGKNRGVFFRPEIKDEVVLGFLNNDPRDPVILGMLHSSAKPAPLTASDDNDVKGFITRSKMKVLFNDDKKEILITTPNGNSMTLSDNDGSIVIVDENSNQIEMNSSGISIKSNGDINIQAGGNVEIKGSSNTTVKAGAQFKAEGSGGAEFSSSGTAVVRGSLVKIN